MTQKLCARASRAASAIVHRALNFRDASEVDALRTSYKIDDVFRSRQSEPEFCNASPGRTPSANEGRGAPVRNGTSQPCAVHDAGRAPSRRISTTCVGVYRTEGFQERNGARRNCKARARRSRFRVRTGPRARRRPTLQHRRAPRVGALPALRLAHPKQRRSVCTLSRALRGVS